MRSGAAGVVVAQDEGADEDAVDGADPTSFVEDDGFAVSTEDGLEATFLVSAFLCFGDFGFFGTLGSASTGATVGAGTFEAAAENGLDLRGKGDLDRLFAGGAAFGGVSGALEPASVCSTHTHDNCHSPLAPPVGVGGGAMGRAGTDTEELDVITRRDDKDLTDSV